MKTINRLIEFMGKVLVLSILTLGSISVMMGFIYFCYWIARGVL